jgi:hypothetical protein
VNTAGGIAHSLLTRADTLEREAGLWLPDQDDVDTIADPLASLAARRAPEGSDNPDYTDLVRVVVGVAGYVVKQLRRRAELREDGAPQLYFDSPDETAAGAGSGPESTLQPREGGPDRGGEDPATGPVAWLQRRHGPGAGTGGPDPKTADTTREETAP